MSGEGKSGVNMNYQVKNFLYRLPKRIFKFLIVVTPVVISIATLLVVIQQHLILTATKKEEIIQLQVVLDRIKEENIQNLKITQLLSKSFESYHEIRKIGYFFSDEPMSQKIVDADGIEKYYFSNNFYENLLEIFDVLEMTNLKIYELFDGNYSNLYFYSSKKIPPKSVNEYYEMNDFLMFFNSIKALKMQCEFEIEYLSVWEKYIYNADDAIIIFRSFEEKDIMYDTFETYVRNIQKAKNFYLMNTQIENNRIKDLIISKYKSISFLDLEKNVQDIYNSTQ